MDNGFLHVVVHASVPVKITMAFMAILSIYTVFRAVERFLTYRKASDQTISFVLGLREHLKTGSMAKALESANSYKDSPVAKAIAAGIHAYQVGDTAKHAKGPEELGDFDIVDSVNRALDRVKEREGSGLRKGLAGLGTVATATPFIGLFGTVIGIINAFALLKGNATIEVIGPAIAEALYSTAFGLVVAILAAMTYNYFTSRVEEMVVDMNDVSSEFLDHVLREGRT
ncbi:MAG TPA: MotA/TolQ/ExbB proton channel family protein [Kofleriaceae bacterium]|nr:MotA/TolQ/ExbB proton channel family protein [Kofleriaceae bacterium]